MEKQKNQHYKNMGIKLQMPKLAFEAESVAYVVCQHFGIDSSHYTFGYLAGWSGDKKMPQLKASLQTIQKTAGQIIEKIEDRYRERYPEKYPDVERELDRTSGETVAGKKIGREENMEKESRYEEKEEKMEKGSEEVGQGSKKAKRSRGR